MAAAGFHDLTDKESYHGLLSAAILLYLFGIRGNDLIDDFFQRAGVADLLQASSAMSFRLVSPEESILGRISLAILPLIFPWAISLINPPRFSALMGDSVISRLCSFRSAARSPMTQLAAARSSEAVGDLFEIIAVGARGGQDLCVVFGEAVFIDEALAAHGGELRHFAADARHPGFADE